MVRLDFGGRLKYGNMADGWAKISKFNVDSSGVSFLSFSGLFLFYLQSRFAWAASFWRRRPIAIARQPGKLSRRWRWGQWWALFSFFPPKETKTKTKTMTLGPVVSFPLFSSKLSKMSKSGKLHVVDSLFSCRRMDREMDGEWEIFQRLVSDFVII